MVIQMNFEDNPEQNSKRRVYRVLAPSITVHFAGHENSFSIADLSAGGMSIQLPNKHPFESGKESVVTFKINNKLILPSVVTKTLRVDQNKNTAAFECVSLDERQMAMLGKLVLALQKHNIKKTCQKTST
jgi:c-di-GMP-binding flagellar brake protein YcgR